MLAAVEYRSTIEKPHQPIEMMSGDDPAIIRTLLRIFSIELSEGFLQILKKFLGHLLKYEDIVRRRARLPGIEPTPEGDATGRNPQIGRRVDDGRALPAELEHHGRQVLRRGGHDHLGNRRSAGEEDVVPLLFQQRGGLGPRAEDDGEGVASSYCGRNRAITSAVAGATSEGLMTAAFPPAIAAISGDRVSISG